MKHLVIRNIGPLKSADIEFQRINVIIGPQSSGKSCVLKIACYCCWVEKRIESLQSEGYFLEGNVFIKELERFHKLNGFIRKDSYIEYETDAMKFSYTEATNHFSFQWKEGRLNYKRTKISYIPSERNLVAAIPNWYEVKFADDNIRSFMSDWEEARKAMDNVHVLNLGVMYFYDSLTKTDKVLVEDNGGTLLDFTNTSSGLQSLIPLYVFLQYFFEKQFEKEESQSIERKSEKDAAMTRIFLEFFVKKGKTQIDSRNGEEYYQFVNVDAAKEYSAIASSLNKINHCDIFLEEPELNLFPSTQHDLINWLSEKINDERKHSLFIATHSPYIMTSINNLIFAGNIVAEEESKREAVEKIVPQRRIFNYQEVAAFAIKDGEVVSIKDEESGLISADVLDSASEVISAEFGNLLML